MKNTKLSTATIVLFGLLSGSACKQNPNSNNAQDQAAKDIQANASLDEDYVLSLYTHHIDDPKLQAHIDENLIIEYILGNDLPYSRHQTGLYYYIVKNGEGPDYSYGAPCRAHYSGYFLDGNVFDSSISKNKPLDFRIGQMVKGWNVILPEVNPGTELKIILPSALAYGERGFPGYVPPNTVIAFDIKTIPVSQEAQ